MRKNAIVALILLGIGVPAAIGAGMQAFALGKLVDATGTDGSVATFTLVVFAVALVASAVGIVFALTTLVQFVQRRSVTAAETGR